ncbi:hypothetical protein ACLOJK_032603 [Asimina triloba]
MPAYDMTEICYWKMAIVNQYAFCFRREDISFCRFMVSVVYVGPIFSDLDRSSGGTPSKDRGRLKSLLDWEAPDTYADLSLVERGLSLHFCFGHQFDGYQSIG